MGRHATESDYEAIIEIVRGAPDGVLLGQIERQLPTACPRRTLQDRIKRLVDSGRLERIGAGRWSRYRVTTAVSGEPGTDANPRRAVAAESMVPLSTDGREIQAYLRKVPAARRLVGYDRSFLEGYRPNESFYLNEQERAELHRVGKPDIGEQPAGTYARRLLDRLLIELSWNSSRLEGNTYSLLDTRRLLAFSQQAGGKDVAEAQMILNHKDAIEFIVSSAEEISFNRYSILNLHGLLANNLLPDPAASGGLRRIPVGIHGSVFHPLEVPALIEECFDQLLATAEAIADPFEQAFFVMAQLPYLQPFEDVNKRVSRLAANIPLIRMNLCPLSFADVPAEIYTLAVLGVYELRRTELLKDVFLWAYRRSAERYAIVRQSLGEPDPFRLRFRDDIRQLVSEVVRGQVGRRAALGHIQQWTEQNIAAETQEKFMEVVETELLSLHEGNFARYRIRPSEFEIWREVWR